MTDQTPRTEAGPYSKIIDGALLAMEREYERGFTEGQAQARTEALDVEVLARVIRGEAFSDARHFDGADKAAEVLAAEYLAILAGETE